MKKLLRLFSAAAVIAAMAVCAAPALVKEEAVILAGLWQLARPPESVTRDFYFGEKQWLADARSVVAALQYLWESRPTAGAIHNSLPFASGAREATLLLTHENSSSNRPALSLPPGADPT